MERIVHITLQSHRTQPVDVLTIEDQTHHFTSSQGFKQVFEGSSGFLNHVRVERNVATQHRLVAERHGLEPAEQ